MNTLNIEKLENVYELYNKREFISPDPLQFLYDYPELKDREIVGLIASTLAYGRVQQILKSIEKILKEMGRSPFEFVMNGSLESFRKTFDGFKHRFTTSEDMALMLAGIKNVIVEYENLENCFVAGMKSEDDDIVPAMKFFVEQIAAYFPDCKTYLLPHPAKGSACKRMNLYLRWMARCDDVDPGGWTKVSTSKLLIPLDTHMNNICRSHGLTKRKNADLKAVGEVTEAFRAVNPTDPTKYDFALTRFGIRDDMDINDILNN